MSTLGQLTIRHEDLEDDACSPPPLTPSTNAQISSTEEDLEDDACSAPPSAIYARQYAVTPPMTHEEVKFQLNEAWLKYGVEFRRGMKIKEVITELPWCANAAALAWEFRNNMDQVVDDYIF